MPTRLFSKCILLEGSGYMSRTDLDRITIEIKIGDSERKNGIMIWPKNSLSTRLWRQYVAVAINYYSSDNLRFLRRRREA